MTIHPRPSDVDLDRLFLGLLYPRTDWLAVCHRCLTVIYHDPRLGWLHLHGTALCHPSHPDGPAAAPLPEPHRTAALAALAVTTRTPHAPDHPTSGGPAPTARPRTLRPNTRARQEGPTGP